MHLADNNIFSKLVAFLILYLSRFSEILNEHSSFFKQSKYEPKIIIISMFNAEEAVWNEPLDFTQTVSITGLAPEYPGLKCTEDYSICQITTGMGCINAASTISNMLRSHLLDLKKTYFMVGGIAGINPYQGTVGSATFAKMVVQVNLQYEFDSRDLPKVWDHAYYPFGSKKYGEYPSYFLGTEIYQLNTVLRDRAAELAENEGNLIDSESAKSLRSLYNFAPANTLPKIEKCDTITSDNFFHGHHIAETFGNYTQLITNGTSTYCTAQEEDNATLQAFLRGHIMGLVNFGHIVILRTASNFDRPPTKDREEQVHFFNNRNEETFELGLRNIVNAGLPFVLDVIDNWDNLYKLDVFEPIEYIGDVFGSLGEEYGPRKFGLSNIKKI